MFNEEYFEKALPSYLTDTVKGRLKEGLKQFKRTESGSREEWSPKVYTDFYLSRMKPHLLQGDVIPSIRFPQWDSSIGLFEKDYVLGMCVSNPCDMETDTKNRNIDKQVLFAPMVELIEFLTDISQDEIEVNQLRSIEIAIKDQEFSNLFYFPPSPVDGKEYVAILDQIFWFPSEEFAAVTPELLENRVLSLSMFGYYLFILKLSYHFCRLPETEER